MKAIYKRELKAYFTSLQAYIYLALFVCVTGIFFTVINLNFGYNDFSSYVLTNSFYKTGFSLKPGIPTVGACPFVKSKGGDALYLRHDDLMRIADGHHEILAVLLS